MNSRTMKARLERLEARLPDVGPDDGEPFSEEAFFDGRYRSPLTHEQALAFLN